MIFANKYPENTEERSTEELLIKFNDNIIVMASRLFRTRNIMNACVERRLSVSAQSRLPGSKGKNLTEFWIGGLSLVILAGYPLEQARPRKNGKA